MDTDDLEPEVLVAVLHVQEERAARGFVVEDLVAGEQPDRVTPGVAGDDPCPMERAPVLQETGRTQRRVHRDGVEVVACVGRGPCGGGCGSGGGGGGDGGRQQAEAE